MFYTQSTSTVIPGRKYFDMSYTQQFPVSTVHGCGLVTSSGTAVRIIGKQLATKCVKEFC